MTSLILYSQVGIIFYLKRGNTKSTHWYGMKMVPSINFKLMIIFKSGKKLYCITQSKTNAIQWKQNIVG